MDSARCALRLGAEAVYIVYRRSEAELPARREEVENAMEEGIIFKFLTNPTRFIGNERGWVTSMECIEMELGELDDSAAEEFRADFGLKECGIDRITRSIYELLGLISFFSTASGEVRAWSIQNGTSALKAAGKIHSDMERGFIRAEVISYPDLMKCGSIAEARKKGLLRLEGKNYTIQDGDVITFLFNV